MKLNDYQKAARAATTPKQAADHKAQMRAAMGKQHGGQPTTIAHTYQYVRELLRHAAVCAEQSGLTLNAVAMRDLVVMDKERGQ